MSIKEVAKKAGVSVATVSYYINNTKNVSPKSAEKIQKAIQDIGYRPNLVARGLRTNENKIIAVLIQDITSGYYNRVLEGIAQVLYQHEYGVSLCITWNNPAYELRDFLNMISRQVSGVIMTPIDPTCNFRALCPRGDFPLVFMDRLQYATDADVVLCDNYNVTYHAIETLIRRGRRHIAYFYSTTIDNVSTARDRLNAYRNALQDNGLPVDERLISFSRQPGDSYQMTAGLFGAGCCPDAIFVASSRMVFGVLRYVQDHQLAVPEDVSIINFDDYDWAEVTAPKPLSTIRQPAIEMGQTAARLMLNRLQDPAATYRTVLLDSKLIERGSS